jgi:hypothetical protein
MCDPHSRKPPAASRVSYVRAHIDPSKLGAKIPNRISSAGVLREMRPHPARP